LEVRRFDISTVNRLWNESVVKGTYVVKKDRIGLRYSTTRLIWLSDLTKKEKRSLKFIETTINHDAFINQPDHFVLKWLTEDRFELESTGWRMAPIQLARVRNARPNQTKGYTVQ
jgi:hypothetical protein